MRPSGILLPAVLLVAACAAPAPAPEASTAGEGLVAHGPFRMRITRSQSNLDPHGKLWFSFETVIEQPDGRAILRDKWFFERPRLAERPVLESVEEFFPQDDVVGPVRGWSPMSHILLGNLPPETRRIRRLVLDIPICEVLEGTAEDLQIAEGAKEIRIYGSVAYEFQASGGGVELLRYGEWQAPGWDDVDAPEETDESAPEEDEIGSGDELTDLPPDGFYQTDVRPIEHAWEITDARGRPFVEGAGFGVGALLQSSYHRDPRVEGRVEHPIVVRWRVPRRWRATMQRFVFEDLVVPAPEPEREPVPPPDDE